jgi:hypothetical protein
MNIVLRAGAATALLIGSVDVAAATETQIYYHVGGWDVRVPNPSPPQEPRFPPAGTSR